MEPSNYVKLLALIIGLTKVEAYPDQADIDYIGSNLQVTAGAINNLEKDAENYVPMQLNLYNSGDTAIQNGPWKLYFNIMYGAKEEELGCGLAVVHVEGDLYYLTPSDMFTDIKPAGLLACEWHQKWWNIAKSDFFPNWYVASDGLLPKIIANTEDTLDYVLPYDDETKWKRSEEDKDDPLTPEDRYKRNIVSEAEESLYRILPTPMILDEDEKGRTIYVGNWVIVNSEDFASEVQYLKEKLKLEVVETQPKKQYISFKTIRGKTEPGEEEYYTLKIRKNNVQIQAKENAGAFYGAQTLISLYEKGEGTLPYLSMEDKPRYSYRGLMIDVAKNFKPKEWIIKLLEVMGMYKLNTLQLHLTDNEGWRFELAEPSLMEVGTQRCHTQEEHTCLAPQLGSGPFVSLPGSGYYTYQDFRDILQYAKDRHITVIPEIHIPGRSRAALQAVSTLTDTPETSGLVDEGSIPNWPGTALNPCLDSTYDFIENVIASLEELYKGVAELKTVHIGGDDVPEGSWLNLQLCEKNNEGTDYTVLKSKAVKKVADILAQKGLDVAVWEDGVYGGDGLLPRTEFKSDNVYTYTWNNVWEDGKANRSAILADADYKVVLSMVTHFHLDVPYEPDPEENGLYWDRRWMDTYRTFSFTPDDIFGNVDLTRMGDYNIDFEGLCPNYDCPKTTKPENILGIQAPMSSAVIRTEEEMHNALFPKLLAIAERSWHNSTWEHVGWTSPTDYIEGRKLDWQNFVTALSDFELPRLEKLGISFRVQPPGAILEEDILKVNALYPNHEVEMSSSVDGPWVKVENNTATVQLTGQTIYLRSVSSVNKRPSRVIPLTLPVGQELIDQCTNLAYEGHVDICSICQEEEETCPENLTTTPAPEPTVTTAPEPTEAPVTTAPVTTPTPEPTEAPVINYRLPTDLVPLSYDLYMQPNMYEGDSSSYNFNGSVTIRMTCLNQTNKVVMHIKDLNIVEETLEVKMLDDHTNIYLSYTVDEEREFLIINTKEDLMPDTDYTVTIDFNGPLQQDYLGLYLNPVETGDEYTNWALSYFIPTHARKAFPCFDEPAMKAQFEVTLARKSDMATVSAETLRDNDYRDDWVLDEYYAGYSISTYQVPIMFIKTMIKVALIGFDINNLGAKLFLIFVHSRWDPENEIYRQVQYATNQGETYFDFYKGFFRGDPPFDQIDILAIPDFPHGDVGMWSAIFVRESSILYKEGVSSEGTKEKVDKVLAKQLALQWFGNKVTPRWWDDFWVQDAFTNYFSFIAVDNIHPDWKILDQFVYEETEAALDMDDLVSSHPVYVPISTPTEIDSFIDSLTSSKGASLMRMLHFIVGDSVFDNGVNKYLRDHMLDVATHDDFWNAFGARAEYEGGRFTYIKDIMDTWILQKSYPLVTVQYTEAGSITISQSRHLRDKEAEDSDQDSPFGYKWDIPFTYTSSGQPNFDVTASDIIMMSKNGLDETVSDEAIPDPNDNNGQNWVIGNCLHYGFYRVNYDERNWNALIEQLKRDHTVIPTINRMQIMMDAWKLSRSGDLNLKFALRALDYLGHETEYTPWESARIELEYLKSMLTGHYLYAPYLKFVHSIVEEPFSNLGLNNDGAAHMESYLRSTVVNIASLHKLPDCLTSSLALFDEWMASPATNPIHSAVRYQVYCSAMAEGGSQEWNFLYERFKHEESDMTDKDRMESALTCSENKEILSRYLSLSLDPNEISEQNSPWVVYYMAYNPAGRDVAWDFLKDNWSYYQGLDPSSYLLSLLTETVASTFNTESGLQEFQNFVKSLSDQGQDILDKDRITEKIEHNIQWLETNAPILEAWLQEENMM